MSKDIKVQQASKWFDGRGGDQIIALDRLAAPHPELREGLIGTEPQRGAAFRDGLEPVGCELIVGAHECLRSRFQLQAVIARPRRVGAVTDLDHHLGERQHDARSSSINELTASQRGRRTGRSVTPVRLVWCD